MAAISNLYPDMLGYTFDKNLQLADTQTITAAGPTQTQVASSNAKVDVGGANTIRHYDAVCDISTVDATTGDERTTIIIQGSNSATFASGNFNLGERTFGDSTTCGESADNVGNERVVIPFCNWRNGTIYQYIRAAVLQAGTTPSVIINQIFLAPKKH